MAAVRAEYGGDSYGALSSKRSYVETDYLQEESVRKRAKLLSVPNRPSAAVLLLHKGNDADELPRLSLLDNAKPLEAVFPSRPGEPAELGSARVSADANLCQEGRRKASQPERAEAKLSYAGEH